MAGEESAPPAEPTELQKAQQSRDWAARQVCQGQAFEWADDKTLICYQESRP